MNRTGISIKKVKHPRYKFRVSYQQGGSYEQRYFKTKGEASDFVLAKRVELTNDGRKHGALTDEERRAVIEARELTEKLANDGIPGFALRDAVGFYAAHLRRLRKSATVEKALRELLETREAEGKSGGHIRDLEYKLNRFVGDHKGRLMASFTQPEVAKWLLGLKCAPQTRLNYKRLLHNLFAFATGRGYGESNPVSGALKIKVPPKDEIGILSVSEAQKLLAACSPEILPAVAIGMFAGLRREEISRLDWQRVKLSEGFIDLKAGVTKTSHRRLVEISENLRAWLKPHVALAGPVRPSEAIYRDRLHDAAEAAGIAEWPHNALRHSFASYHLAMHEDAAKTSLQLGHTESTTLFQHYRELVSKEAAVEFWNIKPSRRSPKNVIPLADVA
jgi:integrase